MPFAFSFHSATLLPSGKVFQASGQSATVYDPATGQFKIVGPMATLHGEDLTTSVLNDGRVLIVGGGYGSYGFRDLRSRERQIHPDGEADAAARHLSYGDGVD